MTNHPPENHRPVTLEDLLRFKRAERPTAEFWTRFESQLRAKQLAAIVAKRPWWRNLSFASVWRHPVSLTAGAVAALAFISLHEYRSRPGPAQPILVSATVPSTHAPAGLGMIEERPAGVQASSATASNAGAEVALQTMAMVEPSNQADASGRSAGPEVA